MTIGAAAYVGMFGAARSEGASRELAAIGRAREWLNSPRQTPETLAGKVVLVQFCTYACINWLRTLPYVRAWAEKYGRELVVLGVHTPEFAFEHDINNVRRALQQLRVTYPVVIDNDYAIWRAFDNHYWPAQYLVDARGRIRDHHFGEGRYDQSERVIQRLLTQAGVAGVGHGVVSVDARGVEAQADWPALRSPENYLGYDRTENFASPGGLARDRRRVYSAPERLGLNRWALVGEWTIGEQATVLAGSNGRLLHRFHARDLHLVMGSASRSRPVRFRVTIDGEVPGSSHGGVVDERGQGIAVEQRLYQLVRQRRPIIERHFEIGFLDAGAEIDRDSRITRVNPGFTKIFGYTAAETIGQRTTDLIVPDDLQEEVEDLMYRMAQTQDVFAVETVRRHKDGTRVPVSLICVPVSSSAGGNAGYVIYRDMTEAKRLQEEQRRYHDTQLALAHANRIATLGQLSASIAHEINQPLTGIITNCGTCVRMLTSDPPNLDGAREAVRRTLRDANRASDVITRLRALFNKQESASESVDLNEATREVIALSLGELQNSRVILRTELADDLQRVTADRVQLQQVVLNLLRNALDAMSNVDDRPRDMLIRTERDEGDSVRLSVKDTGVGFDPHTIDKLFEAFYTTKNDGMGVGLSVSRSIIENHQGRLWAVLNDGPGATFSFSIPSRPHATAH